MSPTQRAVLLALAAGPLTLHQIKSQVPGRHGPTQALDALITQGKVVARADGTYRRR